MSLRQFKDILISVTPNTNHRFASKEVFPYVVFAEMDPYMMRADNRIAEVEDRYFVELYTKKENEPLVDELLAVFDDHEIVVDYSPDYDQTNGIIRHTFTCRVIL